MRKIVSVLLVFILFTVSGCSDNTDIRTTISPYDEYKNVIDEICDGLRNVDTSNFDFEAIIESIERNTNSNFDKEDGFGRIILRFTYSNTLKFEIYDIPFSQLSFYANDELIKVINLI